jgi:hypothetical protein
MLSGSLYMAHIKHFQLLFITQHFWYLHIVCTSILYTLRIKLFCSLHWYLHNLAQIRTINTQQCTVTHSHTQSTCTYSINKHRFAQKLVIMFALFTPQFDLLKKLGICHISHSFLQVFNTHTLHLLTPAQILTKSLHTQITWTPKSLSPTHRALTLKFTVFFGIADNWQSLAQ